MSPAQGSTVVEQIRRIAAREPVRTAIRSRLGIDTRALAAFRIAVGLVVLADLLLLRVPGLQTFYTDDGTLPRTALAESYPTLETVSLHALSGAAWVQGVLFAIAGAVAVMLIVGYRTRLAAIASALLLASMQARNPYVLNGGDTILLTLLVLGVFLPLNARWSIDACRRTALEDVVDDRVCSIASATILLHSVLIYAVNGILKLRSDRWTNGTAVQQIFQLEQYVVLLGPYVAELSMVLVAANWIWTALLVVSPLLVGFTGRPRLALAATFIGAHLGLAATMRLGAFPFVMIAVLLLFFPPQVWERLDEFVTDSDPVSALARSGFESETQSTGTATVEWISPSVRRATHVVASVALLCVFVTFVGWQAAALGLIDPPGSTVIEDDIDDASWSFFAPNPPDGYWWYAWEADLESGETGGTLTTESGAVDRPPDAADRYPTALWMRYGSELRYADADRYESVADYLCDRAGRAATVESASDPETVTIYRVEQPVTADGPVGELEVDERIEYEC